MTLNGRQAIKRLLMHGLTEQRFEDILVPFDGVSKLTLTPSSLAEEVKRRLQL